METVEITFRSKVVIKGKDMAEIANSFSVMDLFSDEARKHGMEFVEVTSVEDPITHANRKPEFNEHF